MDGGKKIEVWGTTEKNKLLVMNKPLKKWCHKEIMISQQNRNIHISFFIAYTNFMNDSKRECAHVWASYRHRRLLISFDAKTKDQRKILDCAELLKSSKLLLVN